MKWFQGSIPEAVAASKAKKAIFVVFVEGKDDSSKEVAQALDSSQVSSILETDKFVAIKLQSDSENYTFFVQIYQLVPVPSIFFIGDNGTPLEIIGNPLSPADLAAKIDTIVLKVNPQAKTSSASLIDAEQKAHSSSSNQETNQSQIEMTKQTLGQSSNDSTNIDTLNSNNPVPREITTPEVSQEEKIRRARELIELQQKKKQQEEERKEREREIERRKMGRDVQKLRQEQQDRELREAQAERLREKAADAAARERILKQIEEDKLERKKKFEGHMQEQVAQQKKAQEEAQAKARATATDMSKARIQFKLPTGNSITGTFEAASTLGSLRSYVVENAQLTFRQFSMSAFFPRRDFTSADDNKTLLELELVPSAVILILPVKSSNSASVIKSADGAGIFSHFLWTLLAPVVSIYNYFVGYFSGRPRGGENDTNNANRNPGSSSGSGNANFSFRPANVDARRFGSQGTSKIRRRGVIHTLHSRDDDNDENNTWNGNSTQQM